ncbi:MAG: NADP-dependent malic enzyme [Cyclobacteriaceae bacterium]|nr:NADP-dependent malic enzyme [Cyclobacteriaceae bacterium]MCH8517048.1 NADP-dependent malic enzyme [Cyclobacteriaceae bacterium]
MSIKISKEDALAYHSRKPEGKIEVVPTKMLSSQRDLALAYSPGVAEPCLAIHENPDDTFKYTAKGNLVGVISNGTAVLGLGDIGPSASKPVMEGKGVLFKKFAGIDVFDIEIDEKDPKKFIDIVRSLEPTFGGINLEDIKAPECFEIEETLKGMLNIPVMHDDQHGTAIITGAALLNALEINGKNIEECRFVVIGAGASATACTKTYKSLGAKHIIMIDKDGVIRKDREDLTAAHAEFATDLDINSIDEALDGADVLLGLSAGNILQPEQLLKMAHDPIVFTLANPNPEIAYELAMSTRDDIIMATGRSDHPNQVNNVLGFPYIFRGALDVRAKAINEEMKIAAIKAIADLAKEPVPELVNKAYNDENLVFGKNYLIPKPLDPRLITTISPAVAKAAMESGVARINITDWEQYKAELNERVGLDSKFISRMINRSKQQPKRIVFAEADNKRILKAAQNIVDEGIGLPVLLGPKDKISRLISENNLDLTDIEIIDPREDQATLDRYSEHLYQKRKRKGITPHEAGKLMKDRNYYGCMMLEMGEADAFVSGLTKDYPRAIRPALHTIGVSERSKKVAGMYVINHKKGPFFFADTTVNVDPSAEDLVDIIGLTADKVKFFGFEPRIAVLSYTNFGSGKGKIPERVQQATAMAKERYPNLIIEGDIQANVALDTELQQENYPFSALADKGANTFIFPNLSSGNIAYKLIMQIGGAEAIGPILLGMKKPVHILQLGSTIREIVNMASIAVVDAQMRDKLNTKDD